MVNPIGITQTVNPVVPNHLNPPTKPTTLVNPIGITQTVKPIVPNQSSVVPQTFSRLFDDANLAKKCVPAKDCQTACDEYNKKHAKEFLSLNIVEQIKAFEAKKAKLPKNEQEWIKNQARLHYSIPPNGYPPGFETRFMFDQLLGFSKYNIIPNFESGYNPYFIPAAWLHMTGLLSTQYGGISQIFNLPLSKLISSDKFAWKSSAAEFAKSMKIELTEEEYNFARKYLDERLDELNQQMQFSARVSRLGSRALDGINVGSLVLPLEQTLLRTALLMPEELDSLTVGHLRNVSSVELEGILLRLNGRSPSLHLPDEAITIANINRLYIHQLRDLGGNKLEDIFPSLPPRLRVVPTKINELQVVVLRTYFSTLFPDSAFSGHKKNTKLQSLSSTQLNQLLDRFDHRKFESLSEQQWKSLDINVIRENFVQLFPKPQSLPLPPIESYRMVKVDMVDMINQLLDLFDADRICRLNFEVLKKIDHSKLSAAQKAAINHMNIPGLKL